MTTPHLNTLRELCGDTYLSQGPVRDTGADGTLFNRRLLLCDASYGFDV